MSFYTIFDQKEPTVTQTTTSVLLSSDPILIASANQKHASQSTVGSVSCQGLISTAATTLTTGTNISNNGVTTITCTSTAIVAGAAWIMADPLASGVCKTLVNLTTTTSTGLTISPVSAGVTSTDQSSGTGTTIQFSAYGAYFELQALSTAQWLVIGRSAAGTKST